MLAWKNTSEQRMRRSIPRTVSLFCCGLLLALGTAIVHAQSGAPFAVRSAYLELIEDVYMLDARLHLPVDKRLSELLKDGLTFRLELQIEVSRARSYWPDEGIAALSQRYELQYHAVSDRYVVRNVNSGEQVTFPDFDHAIERLTRIENLPLLDRTLLQRDDGEKRTYEVRMRAITDAGDTPAALRWVMFWADDWHRVSEWYTWALRP
jgi:hypothetical protein